MNGVLPLSVAGWTPGRKVAAGAFVAAGAAAWVVFASYAAAVLFLVLSHADPRQAGPASIVEYWRLYAADTTLRHRLVVSIGTASGLALLAPVLLLAASRTGRPLHGAARFATRAEIARAGLFLPRGETAPPSILIGRHGGRFLALPGQLSVMLSAPTRSGKGVGVVIPNLLHWPDSVVVLDVKSENHAITAGYRAERGQPVYAFSPFDEAARSHRWNPLSSVRTGTLHRVGDLLSIGQVFYPNEGLGTSSEAFFNDQARNLFLGLGLVLLETPELPRTVGELLRQSSGHGRPLKDHLNALIAQRQEAGRPLSSECVDALQRLTGNSDNTLTSIVATFNAPLIIFADAVVDAATSADDFRLEDLRRQRISVYVRIPPNRLASARPLLALFFSQLVSLNTRQLPAQDPAQRVQCLLVHDEFAAMGRVGIVASAAAFLAGYDLRLLTVVQAMSQLDALYGDKEARTFATNHGLQILFAPREQRDAEEYSAMLGHYGERAVSRGRSRSFSQHGSRSLSHTESEQRRALLLPQEFKELGSERLVAIVENCKPILGEKIRYHRDPDFAARLRPPPPVPAMDMDRHFARVQQRWAYAADELGPGERWSVEDLAHDFGTLPEDIAQSPKASVDALLDAFMERVGSGWSTGGGAIEAVAVSEPSPVVGSDTAGGTA